MNSHTDIDVLIIGQGLAGSLLAWRLINAGASVMVLDNANPAAASRVAAGLINPVSGRRLVLSNNAEAALAEAHALYSELEQRLATPLLHPLPMWRLFRDQAQREQWQRRSADPLYAPFLGAEHDAAPGLRTPFGCAEQQRCARLDTRALLRALRNEFEHHGHLRTLQFDHAKLQLKGDHLIYEDIRASRTIFCEGWRMLENPWFGHLPLQPAQGSILTVELDGALPPAAINRGQWLIPLGERRWRLGASYRWDDIDERPSQAEREALLATLGEMLEPSPGYRLLAEEAGVRPGTRDKAPLLGVHPEHPALAIFNGFGSHGSLLIPWYSARMAEHLLRGAALPASGDVRRLETAA